MKQRTCMGQVIDRIKVFRKPKAEGNWPPHRDWWRNTKLCLSANLSPMDAARKHVMSLKYNTQSLRNHYFSLMEDKLGACHRMPLLQAIAVDGSGILCNPAVTKNKIRKIKHCQPWSTGLDFQKRNLGRMRETGRQRGRNALYVLYCIQC